MGNPLLLLTTRPWSRARQHSLRRVDVPIPTDVPSTDAIFLVLRRMRLPLIVLISVFAISVLGMSLIPGQDAQGRPVQTSVFDAFYFMSYTATTIGFGELPLPFTTTQRMWVTVSIYGSVIGWAYALGALFSLMQDHAFRDAISTQRFRRKVQRIEEPFLIVIGYGQTGRTICRSLDDLGRQFVVIDRNRLRIEALAGDQLSADAPGIDGDARNPALLGLAGLGHRCCEGVLALTDNDETNLAVVMSVHLLRPDLPVIARASSRATVEHMHDFAPQAVINPDDNYGTYLVLAVQRPITYQLVTWLMSPHGAPMPERLDHLASGRWVVAADGRFGREVATDLHAAGLDVAVADPKEGYPDVTGVVGFVAGAESDGTNLSMAAHARLRNSTIFISLRQKTNTNSPLLQAFDPDSVYTPTDLVARESLARLVSPVFWDFFDHVVQQDDEWAQELLDRLVERCGDRSPATFRLVLEAKKAPAAVRWLARGGQLSVADLLRDPDERDHPLPAYPLVHGRGETVTFCPDLDLQLREGDRILLAGRNRAFDLLSETLFYDATVEFVATGRQVPTTWLWRTLTAVRKRAHA